MGCGEEAVAVASTPFVGDKEDDDGTVAVAVVVPVTVAAAVIFIVVAGARLSFLTLLLSLLLSLWLLLVMVAGVSNGDLSARWELKRRSPSGAAEELLQRNGFILWE